VNIRTLLPLAGALFVILAIVSFIVGGEPPDADEGAAEIVEFYVDNEDSLYAGVYMLGLALLALLLFAAHLRNVLSDAAGGRSTPATLVLVGASILATGAAIDGTLTIALTSTAGDIDPASTVALQALWDNDFLPMALGTAVILLSAGIAGVTTGGLPKWLAWIALILGVLGATPLGFVAFIGGAVWIVVTSIVLAMGARPAQPAAGTGAP
jgi:hypothetical protein